MGTAMVLESIKATGPKIARVFRARLYGFMLLFTVRADSLHIHFSVEFMRVVFVGRAVSTRTVLLEARPLLASCVFVFTSMYRGLSPRNLVDSKCTQE